ncbi:hypothetical protein B0H21DRAFT_715896 [Amylocystis lapponica]|nr:hypothetical protein B0H21DRAFT_715896 [Amylocystis lapponica]
MASSAIRRKPLYTFKSPTVSLSVVDAPIQAVSPQAPKAHPKVLVRPGTISLLSDSGLVAAEHLAACARAVRPRKAPPLPLYHPLGPLALSLPELDPALFGLPNSLTVDDDDSPHSRRASSRSRRPAAKVRDRNRGDDERNAPQATAPTQMPEREAGGRDRTGSPRKRRAGGTKRKRKEVDEVDGVYPPPAKRTRNPRRGANSTPSVASPLVSAAVATQDVESAVEVPTPVEAVETEEAHVEPLPPVEPKRTSRSRKARAPASRSRRRNSSASETTTTSVSVSIAANTRKGRGARAEARAQDAASEKSDKSNSAEGREEEGESRGRQGPAAIPESIQDPLAEQHVERANVAMDGTKPAPVGPSSIPLQEEKEEGELSDEP